MKPSVKKAVIYGLFAVAASLLINSLEIYVQHLGVSPDGSKYILDFSLLFRIAIIFAAFLVIISSLLLIFRKTRRVAAFLIIGCLAYSFAALPCFKIGNIVRMKGFERLAERSAPLVNSIHEYERSHGKPPAKLEHLVPEFLPAVPETGMGAYPDYKYEVFSNSKSTLAWYDLGSREGRKIKDPGRIPEGDPGHAVAAFTFNAENEIIGAKLDRMPEDHDQIAFDRDLWLQKKSRIEMIRSLPEVLNMEGMSSGDLIEFLGEPDGQKVTLRAPWELSVHCPASGIRWNLFFYWPTGNYPEHAYGGSVKRIGDWAYIYE